MLFDLQIIVCFMALTIASINCDVNELTTPSSESVTQASPITIDPKLRKALLEALTSFGGEESTESEEDFGTTTDGGITDFPEDITNNPLVKIHSFAIDGDKSNENEIIKTIIISRPRTTLTPPKTNNIDFNEDKVEINFGKTPDPINQEEEVKIDNIQLARSVATNISAASNNNVEKKEEKLKKKTSVKSVTKPITPQPTTTTLPPPVTNSDGENIEKVKGEDVKIFQAPLLAAFTVQQVRQQQYNDYF